MPDTRRLSNGRDRVALEARGDSASRWRDIVVTRRRVDTALGAASGGSRLADGGGWTWYTGSARWMDQLPAASLLGVQRRGRRLMQRALLPPRGWRAARGRRRHRAAGRRPHPAGRREGTAMTTPLRAALTPDAQPRSDALVVFGFTGDLATKQVLPALYRLARSGRLDGVTVVGVADTALDDDGARRHARACIEKAGPVDDAAALERLLRQLRYVSGDYARPETFAALKQALGPAHRPAHYLAIPPALFATVIRSLGDAGLAADARVIVEKPFGHDLASAVELGRVAQSVFAEESIFRIDHYLGKEAITGLVYFRFANSFLEPVWNRDHIASVQITLAEDFGIEGRGAFYEHTGALRDVVQNHLLQVVVLLALEPPGYRSLEAIRAARSGIFHAMRPLVAGDVVRGQYDGYRQEKGVAADSDVETYCAVRLFIDSWRWAGVPWLLRTGKKLPTKAMEVLVELKPPPQTLFQDGEAVAQGHERRNYFRFELQPGMAVALAARVKSPGLDFVGTQQELYLAECEESAETPYERLLSEAMAGVQALFTSQEAVEAAWAVVEPVLAGGPPCAIYAPGSWGPDAADTLIAEAGSSWHAPQTSTVRTP